jgi:Eco57I restriction-modification methylase
MRNGDTRLDSFCEYMVKPDEDGVEGKKDPRDIRIIDPACGSGHFLLYCFVLLLLIYEEAWADEAAPKSAATGSSLRHDYPSLEELRKAAPQLILQHNLHGVDIDPRCAQIAQLALWMRAQRAFKDAGVQRADRPKIRRANIVIAEPMPGDPKLVDEFAATLRPAIMGNLFKEIVSEMRLAGEMGPLLPIERKLAISIDRARVAFMEQQKHGEGFLPGLAPIKRQAEFDLSGIDNLAFFEKAEEQIFSSLKKFVSDAVNGRGTRRKLFADDAEQGIAFVELMSRKFDVVLMNPPFGAGSLVAKKEFEKSYPRTKNDVYAAFVERGVELLHPHGMLGAITSRTGFFLSSFQKWREEILLKEAPPVVFADLGNGVLDSAMVEVAAYCLEKGHEVAA